MDDAHATTHLTPQDIVAMLDAPDIETRRSAAADPLCPIAAVQSRVAAALLAEGFAGDDPSYGLFWGAAEHPDAPPEMLAGIALVDGQAPSDYGLEAQAAVAAHAATPATTLSDMVRHSGDFMVQLPLAANPHTPPDALHSLARWAVEDAHLSGEPWAIGDSWTNVAIALT